MRYEAALYKGDTLEVMSKFADRSVDMILCDLPYGTTACKWDTVIPFEPLWEQYKRVIKPNGAIVLYCSGRSRSLRHSARQTSRNSAIRGCGRKILQQVISTLNGCR